MRLGSKFLVAQQCLHTGHRALALAAAFSLVLAPTAFGQLNADFSATPTSGVNQLSVSFTDLTTGATVGSTPWVWDFGDGTTSSDQNPTHVYMSPGSFTVSLDVFDLAVFMTDTETKAGFITVTPAPLSADFSASPLSGTNVLPVTFTDNSVGAVTGWSWDFGDGTSSTESNPVHSYTAPGTYTVSLTVFVGQQSDVLVKTSLITVTPAVFQADFSASPTQGENPLTVSFTDLSTGAPPTAWFWVFSDGMISTDPNPTHTYTSPGIYGVSLMTSVGQQTDTKAQIDLINVLPAVFTVDFSATPTSGTNPLTVAFTDGTAGASATAWNWTFGDGNTSTEQNPSHTYLSPGTYDVSLTAFVGDQSGSQTKMGLVQVAPASFVTDFSATPSQGANPLLVAFTDTTTGAPTTAWQWTFGDGSTSSEQNPQHSYTAPGLYTVSLDAFVGTQQQLLGKVDLILVDPATFSVNFASSVAMGTSPLEVNFEDLTEGAETTAWMWNFGDGTSSTVQNPTHIYTTGDQAAFTVNLTAFVGQQSASLQKMSFIVVEGTFISRKISDKANGATSVRSVDFDGDGDGDVLSASEFDDKIAWYENVSGGGGFSDPQIISLSAGRARSVDAADLDGDGDNDALSASFQDDKIAWYENTDGLGSFGPETVISSAANGAESVFVMDVDGDGDPDVLSASSQDNSVAWYENVDGQATFGPRQIISAAALGAKSVHGADFDGDGDADVVSTTDSGLKWFANLDGNGTFGPPQGVSTFTGGPRSVQAADLDGDGDFDILSAFSGDGRVWWFRNNDGLGSFSPPQPIDLAANGAWAAIAADLDGDSEPDVVSAASFDNRIAWYPNIDGFGGVGFGGFDNPQDITNQALGVRSVDASDIDRDGDLDVVSASFNDDSIYWHENPLASPIWPHLGNGLKGLAGTPVLQGMGQPIADQIVTMKLSAAKMNSLASLVIGVTLLKAPFKGGVLVPSPDIIFSGLLTDDMGQLVVSGRWPTGVPVGTALYLQCWIVDPAGPQGFSASNGLKGTTSQ